MPKKALKWPEAIPARDRSPHLVGPLTRFREIPARLRLFLVNVQPVHIGSASHPFPPGSFVPLRLASVALKRTSPYYPRSETAAYALSVQSHPARLPPDQVPSARPYVLLSGDGKGRSGRGDDIRLGLVCVCGIDIHVRGRGRGRGRG